MMPVDIIVTLPATTPWSDYQRELDAVADGERTMRFKVPHLPRKPVIGGRCYLVHRGVVVGWMQVTSLYSGDQFTCTTTGRKWQGHFIGRSGRFHPLPTKVLWRGFQGWRYCWTPPGTPDLSDPQPDA